ncbi:MAG: hypothetical protein COA74_02350 [Gammaproteobacteria bacterium]|nr:MAG: hypothetical protein COA74_02350 [Gammaproteobacteria bacterium]
MIQPISAIVPVFNAEKYLADTLASLLNQTVPLLQIIIIDDCSTDKSVEIIRQFCVNNASIEFHQNSQNRGVSYTRNKAVTLVKSQYFLLLDADDLIDSKLVSKAQDYLVSNKTDILFCAYQQIDENGDSFQGISRFKQVDDSEMLGYEFVRNQIYLSGTILKKSTFESYAGFNTQIRICEDWDLWIKFAQGGHFIYLDEALVFIRRHRNNVSANIDEVVEFSKAILNQYSVEFIRSAVYRRNLAAEQNCLDFVSILYLLGHWEDGFKILISEISRTNKSLDYRISAKAYFYRGLYYIKSGDFNQATSQFKKATLTDPDDAACWNNLGICILLSSIDNDPSNLAMPNTEVLAESRECFTKALSITTSYLDASFNLKWIEKAVSISDFKVTMKPLRQVLLHYQKL